MDKLLLVGADSMLGANLALALLDRFDCTGLSNKLSEVAGCRRTVVGDALDSALVESLVAAEHPNWVIYVGSISRSSWDAVADQRPASTAHTAQQLVQRLAEITADCGAALTVLSSDTVFTGPRLFHEEPSRPTADTPFAREVRAVENAVAPSKHALVVRTHAYGWSATNDAPCLVETLAEQLATGQPATIDGLRYATPILATDLADLLAIAYENELRGLYHITGAERTNLARFTSELSGALDLRLPAPAECENTASAMPNNRPVTETSLNTRRARRDLGLPMPLLREGLERLAAQHDNGFLARLRGEPAPSSKRAHAA
jgi:dTDP-4-dehydrorhamnose reductase